MITVFSGDIFLGVLEQSLLKIGRKLKESKTDSFRLFSASCRCLPNGEFRSRMSGKFRENFVCTWKIVFLRDIACIGQ